MSKPARWNVLLPRSEVGLAWRRSTVAWLRAFLPAPVLVDAQERWRVVVGALLGVLLTALVARWCLGTSLTGTWLVAPLGASAVLVFAAPASPLAQPWSVVGGNGISALVGLLCASHLSDPLVAGPVAVSLSIAVMFAMRCLHPPGGAMALSVVLAHAAHGHFPVVAAVLDSLVLVAAGVAYNAATGRPYPHAQRVPAAVPVASATRFTSADLDAVLARYNQVLDVSRDDLESILQAAELESVRRRTGELLCRDVMSRNVLAVQFGSTLQEAWRTMRTHKIKALPVIDQSRRVVGIITMADFLREAAIDDAQSLGNRLRQFIRPDGLSHSGKPAVVGQIMTRQVRVTSAHVHVVELMHLFTEDGHHHIPVIDGDKRLAGIITQSDFVRALHRANEMG